MKYLEIYSFSPKQTFPLEGLTLKETSTTLLQPAYPHILVILYIFFISAMKPLKIPNLVRLGTLGYFKIYQGRSFE